MSPARRACIAPISSLQTSIEEGLLRRRTRRQLLANVRVEPCLAGKLDVGMNPVQFRSSELPSIPSDMAYVTLQIGPTWKMQLLRGLLEKRGLPAVVLNDSLSVYLGQAPTTSQLQVPEEVLETARAAVEEAQRDGNRALEGLHFGQHERFSAPPQLRAMLMDVAFWLTLILMASLVFSSIYFSCVDPEVR